ncbi:MAG: nucleotidyl transferase AbiEii/AbiGii toxin family protein [Candidatus Micrarchaeota archaeon]
MIDRGELDKIAKLNNLRSWQQEKHYVQSVILVALSEFPIVFKGGTYLWFFHRLNRFSEDLDFTSAGKLPENLGEIVSENLGLFGIENELKAGKKSDASLSFRIGAKGPLHTSPKHACFVYIEISTRENVLMRPLALQVDFPYYDLPLKVINGMALEEVGAEKVRAIMTREKARDVFDLAYLIKEKNIGFRLEMVNEKLKYYDMEFSESLFGKKVAEKKSVWKAELKQFIAGELPDFESAEKSLVPWAGD